MSVEQSKKERVRSFVLKLLAIPPGELADKHVKDTGDNLQISCPFAAYTPEHRSLIDKHPSLGILVTDGGPSPFHCWTCGVKGLNLVHLIERLEQKNAVFAQFKKEAEEIEGSELERLAYSLPAYESDVAAYADQIVPEAAYRQFAGLIHPYLISRGVLPDTAKRWEAGYDESQHRVVFPVRTKLGALVGCVGRATSKAIWPPYLNYWNFDKGRFLFGHQLVKPQTVLIVVEGVFDAVMTWQRLGDMRRQFSVVATMGAEITDYQVDLLIDAGQALVVGLDNDAPGVKGKGKLIDRARRRFPVYQVRYPQEDAKDPDALGERFIELVLDPDIVLY